MLNDLTINNYKEQLARDEEHYGILKDLLKNGDTKVSKEMKELSEQITRLKNVIAAYGTPVQAIKDTRGW